MKKIVILTGSELRHRFFHRYLALSKGITVLETYCEGLEQNLRNSVSKDASVKDMRMRHLSAREQSEEDFFGLFLETTVDCSNPIYLPRGQINSSRYINAIVDSAPDLLVSYGCSIVRDPLLSAFHGRFINVHLGLSPYYRGSGTNYWPLVNEEPEYVGATFMHIDSGIDTGEIIHQIRAKCCWGDSPSQIGNRLILDMTRLCEKIIINFDRLKKMKPLPNPSSEKVYKKNVYSEESVVELYKNFKSGLMERYETEQEIRCAQVPIICNPGV